MGDDPLRTVIDGIRTRLQSELESHLSALTDTHQHALEEARRAADAAAEQRWAVKLDVTRAELAAQLQSEVAAARSEVERTMVAESMRMRVEAEQAAAEAASHARRELEQVAVLERERANSLAEQAAQTQRELEQALNAERERAQAATAAAEQARRELEQAVAAERERAQTASASAEQVRRDLEQGVTAERERAQSASASAEQARHELEQAVAAERERARLAVDAERQRTGRELSQARAALDAERERTRRVLEDTNKPSPTAVNTAGLLQAVRSIDTASSLSDTLAAVVRGAALDAPRVALFIVNGTQLQEWPVAGVPAVQSGSIKADQPEAGILGEALRTNETVVAGRNGAPPAPAFAALPSGRVALAIPFVLGDRTVAVLYADEGITGEAPASWQETVQILGRHASAYVAYFTAMRTAQAMQFVGTAGDASAEGAGADAGEEAQGARRYARLLVSEIKLYNESAVRLGRERRDLLQRLQPEIERARRLYEERVAPSIAARDMYFDQELVQTLADGDHSLLGEQGTAR